MSIEPLVELRTWSFGAKVLAHVACAFSPADVEDDKAMSSLSREPPGRSSEKVASTSLRETSSRLLQAPTASWGLGKRCRSMSPGGGGWFYGRIISSTSSSAPTGCKSRVSSCLFFGLGLGL